MLAVLGQSDLALPFKIEAVLKSRADVFVSVVSIWEIAIKNRIGKLAVTIDINSLPRILEGIDISVIDILADHALAQIGPEPITKDPFDRLLLGVCAAERMKLLTIDKALVDHPLAWR